MKYKDKNEATIANRVLKTWLCRYLRTKIITYEPEKEFLGHEFFNIPTLPFARTRAPLV